MILTSFLRERERMERGNFRKYGREEERKGRRMAGGGGAVSAIPLHLLAGMLHGIKVHSISDMWCLLTEYMRKSSAAFAFHACFRQHAIKMGDCRMKQGTILYLQIIFGAVNHSKV